MKKISLPLKSEVFIAVALDFEHLKSTNRSPSVYVALPSASQRLSPQRRLKLVRWLAPYGPTPLPFEASPKLTFAKQSHSTLKCGLQLI